MQIATNYKAIYFEKVSILSRLDLSEFGPVAEYTFTPLSYQLHYYLSTVNLGKLYCQIHFLWRRPSFLAGKLKLKVDFYFISSFSSNK